MANSEPTKMERLMFKACIWRGLKGVEDKTKLPYPTLINVNRGYQMIKDKKVKYTASRGTRMILEKFFKTTWDNIFEDKSGEEHEERKRISSSVQKVMNEAMKASSNKNTKKGVSPQK